MPAADRPPVPTFHSPPPILIMLEFLTHVSCALSMGAFLVRDMLWLRALAITASLVWITAMFVTDTIIVASVFWNSIFISINTWQITSLRRENRAVTFTEEEKLLYHDLFHHFKPGEFLKFIRLGTWQDLPAHTILVEKDQPTAGIWLLSHGEADVFTEPGDPKATLAANDFIGEMSYLTTDPPSATVRMKSPGRALFWPKEKLHSFFLLHPTLKAGYHSVISANLADKLRR